MTAIVTVLDISAIVNDSPGAHQYALQKAASGLLVPVTLNLTEISNGGGSVSVASDGGIKVAPGAGKYFEIADAGILFTTQGQQKWAVDNLGRQLSFYAAAQNAYLLTIDGGTGNVGMGRNIFAPAAQSHVINSNPAQPVQILQLATGQTAPGLQLQDSFGDVLAQVDAAGGAQNTSLRIKNSNIADLIFEDTLSGTTSGIRYNGLALHFLNYLGGYSASLDATGQLTIGSIAVAGHQILTGQQPAIANATNVTDVITQLNTLLSELRTHGLIAT